MSAEPYRCPACLRLLKNERCVHCTESFEERAAVYEFEAGMSRADAEAKAGVDYPWGKPSTASGAVG